MMILVEMRKKTEAGNIFPLNCPFNGTSCVFNHGQCVGYKKEERGMVFCTYDDWATEYDKDLKL